MNSCNQCQFYEAIYVETETKSTAYSFYGECHVNPPVTSPNYEHVDHEPIKWARPDVDHEDLACGHFVFCRIEYEG